MLLRFGFVFGLVFFVRLASAAPVETNVPGLTAELLELRQQGGVLRLAVRYVNTETKPVVGGLYNFSEVYLVNAKSKQKLFGIKDAEGKYLAGRGPFTDENRGGRFSLRLPPKSDAVMWMLFDPVAAGTTLSVQLPKAFPFDDVAVQSGAGNLLAADSATSSPSGVRLKVVSATRSNQQLRVRLRLEGQPSAGLKSPIYLFNDVYVFDTEGKRKYPLLKDADGIFMGQPLAGC